MTTTQATALRSVLETLKRENDKPGSPICDTIWHTPHQTLFDFIEMALEDLHATTLGEATPEAIIRSRLVYDPETGALTWSADTPRAKAGTQAGWFSISGGYRQLRIKGVMYMAHRVAWLLMTGDWPKNLIDHINGDGNDNRWSNLRDVTTTVNMQNQKKAPSNNKSSGLLGVTRSGNRWSAQITVNGRVISLGCYATAQEAHSVYIKAKRELHEGCTI